MWQITELLSEVRVNYDKTVVIQHLLRKLYEVVQNVPEQEVLMRHDRPRLTDNNSNELP